jgi:hypothetical protein
MRDLVMFALGAAVPSLGYLIKRFLQKSHIDEELGRTDRLVDIKRKMDEGGISIGDTHELQKALMDAKPKRNAIEGKAVDEKGPDQEGTLEVTARAKRNVLAELDAGDPVDFGDGPQGVLNIQQGERLERANSILTRAAGLMESALEGEPVEWEQFKKSQHAWEAYRDAQADFASMTFAGGSMQPLIRWGVATRITIERIVEIRVDLWERGVRI